LVAGLPRDKGEFVLARLSQVASDAGIPLAPEKCAPNFLVVVTPDPDEMRRLLNEDSPPGAGGNAAPGGG